MHYIYYAYVSALMHLLTYLLTYLLTQLALVHKASNISEKVDDRAKATINGHIKSYTGFRLPPKCMTLNDL